MHVIDSHTGGMPTRVILDCGPELGSGPLADRARRLATEYDELCKSILLEPRGQPGMLGAFLVEPVDPSCVTGVIYFDAKAVLGMCGHGTIGLAVTLAELGRIDIGTHRIETPAGVVTVELHDANTVSVINVESYCVKQGITIDVEGYGPISGDIAYGGNWFFIEDAKSLEVTSADIRILTERSIAIRETCNALGIGGPQGQAVDHVIISGASPNGDCLKRNFVLCPDDEYDRSPCGTGSSAFTACLAAVGRLEPGKEIVLESVIGSSYHLSYQPGSNGGIIPTLTGEAHVMAKSTLMFAETDPFRNGISL